MKTNYLKKFFLGIIPLMFFSFQTYAQDSWTLHSEVNGVQAHYQITTCQSESVVFVKFVNSNSYSVNITWDEEMTFEGSSNAQTVNTEPLNLVIPSGETIGNTCIDTPTLELVSRPNIMLAPIPSDPAISLDESSSSETMDKVITSFNFINIQVTQ